MTNVTHSGNLFILKGFRHHSKRVDTPLEHVIYLTCGVDKMDLDIRRSRAPALSKAEPESRESTLTGTHFAEPLPRAAQALYGSIPRCSPMSRPLIYTSNITGYRLHEWHPKTPEMDRLTRAKGARVHRINAPDTPPLAGAVPSIGIASVLPSWRLGAPGSTSPPPNAATTIFTSSRRRNGRR